MRKISIMGITAASVSVAEGDKLLAAVGAKIDDWISTKGTKTTDVAGSVRLNLGDKGLGTLVDVTSNAKSGRSRKVVLDEPIHHSSGVFRTTLHYALGGKQIDFVCMLEFENPEYALTPAQPIAHLPGLMQNIIRLSKDWKVGQTTVVADSSRILGDAGGALAKSIVDKSRALPLVVVSEYRGKQAVEKLSEQLAKELAGLATIVEVDGDAAWAVSQELGSRMSCFGGAVKLYWPMPESSGQLLHPSWSRDEILAIQKSTHGGGIRERLRTILFDISTYRPRFSDLIRRIDDEMREEYLAEKIRHVKTSDEEVVRVYADDNKRMMDEISGLRVDLSNAEARLRAELELATVRNNRISELETGSPKPEKVEDFTSVREAVTAADARFDSDLFFGDDVGLGIGTLNPKAGPPDKIFNWLGKLAELSRLRASGKLKVSFVQWLKENGIACSGESEQKSNNVKEQRKRTWDAGGSAMTFDLHLKLKEKTDPPFCARIYFSWSDKLQKMVVGWVGQHPK